MDSVFANRSARNIPLQPPDQYCPPYLLMDSEVGPVGVFPGENKEGTPCLF